VRIRPCLALLLVGAAVPAWCTVPPPTAERAAAAAAAAGLTAARGITTEAAFRRAWADPLRRHIALGADLVLRNCRVGDPIRESPYPLELDGNGHTIRQSCFEKRVLRQDGTGHLLIHDIGLTRGGSDGPGAALTSRGEISLADCEITQNLAEEPGGGVFSMRGVEVHRCHINGNLANDDGGAIYARRGGVRVYDSVLSNNLVDGSGGAIGSTGDILVVRSKVDGNTTDGDGGALYADEDGDVTVIDSLIDGSDADGPGGAIFTLDGDVAVVGSTLNGNRADDRGGAISGEADVLVVNSNIARNLAVAHAGGGIWARGNLTVVNSTITQNYAEGEGGGVLSAGRTTVISSTITHNIAPVAGDIGSAHRLDVFGSIIGPPVTEGVTGDTIPSHRSCRVYDSLSRGYNFYTEDSCELESPTDVLGTDPQLVQIDGHPLGFVLMPTDGSPVQARIPSGSCRGVLPDPLPAGQLLAAYVDWAQVLARDTLGQLRDVGGPCDIGAAQSGRPASPAPLLPGSSGTQDAAPAAVRVAGPRPQVVRRAARTVDARIARLAHRLRVLQHRAKRFDRLLACTRYVGVSRAGDPQHRWGFAYDERDGTGLDHRPALVRAPVRRADALLLRMSTSRRCLSAAPDPNGTGADARAAARPGASGHGARLRRLARLERLAKRIEAKAARFDRWESCLSWLPVTEDGDARQDLGFLTRRSGVSRHLPAIGVDTSQRDDPDYELLVRRGRGRCAGDAGESVDRTAREADVRGRIASLREDVEDLVQPVQEITQFDECMYTVGLRQRSGYLFEDRRGRSHRRTALSFDLSSGSRLPVVNVMATSGEEPPQIECNEDAGLADDDDG
jgi:polymorphic membrane protein